MVDFPLFYFTRTKGQFLGYNFVPHNICSPEFLLFHKNNGKHKDNKDEKSCNPIFSRHLIPFRSFTCSYLWICG